MYKKLKDLIKKIESGNYSIQEDIMDILTTDKGFLFIDPQIAGRLDAMEEKLNNGDPYEAINYTKDAVKKIKQIIAKKSKDYIIEQ